MDLPESFPIFFFLYIRWVSEECIKFFFIIFKPPFLLMFYIGKGFLLSAWHFSLYKIENRYTQLDSVKKDKLFEYTFIDDGYGIGAGNTLSRHDFLIDLVNHTNQNVGI